MSNYDTIQCLSDRVALHKAGVSSGPDMIDWVWLDLLRRLTAGSMVLDVGAGLGGLWKGSIRRDIQAILLDKSSAMIGHLKEILASPQFSLIQAGAERLPFCENSFDAIFAHSVMHYVETPQTCLEAMHELLKYAGFLSVLLSAPGNLQEMFDFFEDGDYGVTLEDRRTITSGESIIKSILGSIYGQFIKRNFVSEICFVDPKPIVRHLLSHIELQNFKYVSSIESDLLTRLGHKIERDGHFAITKRYSHFICRKPLQVRSVQHGQAKM